MRSQAWSTILLAIAAISIPAYASSPDDKPIDQDSIAALEARIPQAQPREQCFLYAELIHQMTEFSLKQYAAGDVDKATDLLKQIQAMTHKMHLSVAENDKRLKNAEILHAPHRFPPQPDAAQQQLLKIVLWSRQRLRR